MIVVLQNQDGFARAIFLHSAEIYSLNADGTSGHAGSDEKSSVFARKTRTTAHGLNSNK
jgi:hypothetical protein